MSHPPTPINEPALLELPPPKVPISPIKAFKFAKGKKLFELATTAEPHLLLFFPYANINTPPPRAPTSPTPPTFIDSANPGGSPMFSTEPFPTYLELKNIDAYNMTANGALGLENVRQLSLEQRQALRPGSSVNFFIGDKWICCMPWRLFQTVSTKAIEVDTRDPSHLQMSLPTGLGPQPFIYIMEWLNDITNAPRFYLLRRRDSVFEDVAVCRAARLLGMTEYAQHIFNHYWATFKNDKPKLEYVSAIEEMAATEEKAGLTDCDATAFFHCLAKRLGHMIYFKEVEKPEELTIYLIGHPKMKQAVTAVVDQLTERDEPTRGRGRKRESGARLPRPANLLTEFGSPPPAVRSYQPLSSLTFSMPETTPAPNRGGRPFEVDAWPRVTQDGNPGYNFPQGHGFSDGALQWNPPPGSQVSMQPVDQPNSSWPMNPGGINFGAISEAPNPNRRRDNRMTFDGFDRPQRAFHKPMSSFDIPHPDQYAPETKIVFRNPWEKHGKKESKGSAILSPQQQKMRGLGSPPQQTIPGFTSMSQQNIRAQGLVPQHSVPGLGSPQHHIIPGLGSPPPQRFAGLGSPLQPVLPGLPSPPQQAIPGLGAIADLKIDPETDMKSDPAQKSSLTPEEKFQLSHMWAQKHAQALREMNMQYRAERYQKSVNPSFQLSNPEWAFNPPRIPQGMLVFNLPSDGAAGHQRGTSSGDMTGFAAGSSKSASRLDPKAAEFKAQQPF